MTFSQAQQEFQIRYYLWATTEFEKEIDSSFPVLRTFKCGESWRLYQFMQRLERSEQVLLARGLLKKIHKDAVDTLREVRSDEENSICEKYYAFWRMWELFSYMQHLGRGQELTDRVLEMKHSEASQILGENWLDEKELLRPRLEAVFDSVPPPFEEEVAARRRSGDKLKFASKRRLQTAVTKAFRDAFGSRCINFRATEKIDPTSEFDQECCGWVVSTQFWYGRRESLINYTHLIASPTRIAHPDIPEITAPDMLLANCISFGCWLGTIGQWEYLMPDDVQLACDAAVKLCGKFFDVAPKLLKGLEFDKITSE